MAKTQKERKQYTLPPEQEVLFHTDGFPVTEETACGFGHFRGPLLQKLANKNVYVCLYGLMGCIYASSYAYFNSTITTIEKRFKIPSRTTGIISVGNDFSQLFVAIFLSYYAGKGHRPRWLCVGIYFVVLFCLMTALPHFIYGPGDDALELTVEYGVGKDMNYSSNRKVSEKQLRLCDPSDNSSSVQQPCGDTEEGSLSAPVFILFFAQFVAGIGGTIYYTLGLSYLDDNSSKGNAPALISVSFFLRMLGPAMGYALGSFCLKYYISPTLTPTIDTLDPRWLGAWWIGWIVIACCLFVSGSVMALMPSTLPRSMQKKMEALQNKEESDLEAIEEEQKPSLKDLMKRLKRLATNRIFMYNTFASVFYVFGYLPFWIFMAKYIETQYRKSASDASIITGTVGLVFSALGVLISGFVISKFKPGARKLAGWNVFVGIVTALGMACYMVIGCPSNDHHGQILESGELDVSAICNMDCHCESAKYSPVCSIDGSTTYISPCHAGCQLLEIQDGSKIYRNCSCVSALSEHLNLPVKNQAFDGWPKDVPNDFTDASALPGACPVDCASKFIAFLAIVCVLKFIGATGRASNFLIYIRCVDEKDKALSMGVNLFVMNILAFIPSPIFFGVVFDNTCLVWGKTCSGKGNCWLYNGITLRYLLNLLSAAFILIGTLCDTGVWYYVKDLKVFDLEEEKEDNNSGEKKKKKKKSLFIFTDS